GCWPTCCDRPWEILELECRECALEWRKFYHAAPMPEPLLVAKGDSELCLLPRYANRHGLIAGATGTGKTVTLQRIAEGLSRIGVPVFMADVKGDLAGLSQPGEAKGKVQERLDALKLKNTVFEACPVVFWDAFGAQ